MNDVQEIEWEVCCVCDGAEKGDLRSSTEGTVYITTNYVVGEDVTEHPDFEHVMLRRSTKYENNCLIQYSPYNLARKKKSLQGKNKKAEVGQYSAFLHSSTDSNFHSSSSSASPNPICIICGEHDAIENLHAAGAFHLSKSKLNTG